MLNGFWFGSVTGSNRVIRGGSWDNNARNLRAANRNNDDPGNRNPNLGVRLLSSCLIGQMRRVYGRGARAQGMTKVPEPAPPALAGGQREKMRRTCW